MHLFPMIGNKRLQGENDLFHYATRKIFLDNRLHFLVSECDDFLRCVYFSFVSKFEQLNTSGIFSGVRSTFPTVSKVIGYC